MPAEDHEHAVRLAIVRRLREREDELLGIVFRGMLTLPEYAEARSGGEIEDIRSGARRSVELCLLMLAEDRRLDADELVALHLTGGQRARQGIPKHVVLRSVTVATREGYNFIETCVDHGGSFDATTSALRRIRTIIGHFEDDATTALADGHDEAYGQLLTQLDRGEAILLDRLLEKRWFRGDELLDHAAAVGLHPSEKARVLVVTTLDAANERRLRGAVSHLRNRVPMAVGPLRFQPRIHLPLVIQDRDATWEALLADVETAAEEHTCTVVYGERADSLLTVASSYKAIERGLPFVRAATGEPGAIPALIVRFHRVTCVGKPVDRMELLADVLGPLMSLHTKEQDELLSTLDAMYEAGGSRASVARTIGLHKNTLANRVRRIRELTGLDIRRPAERLELETMLRLRFVAEADLMSSDRTDQRSERPA